METTYKAVRAGDGYRCWAEVDLDALRQNLAWIRHRVGPNTRIMTVVKADAYGHGLKQIAALLMQSGTDVFGVANLIEAAHIRTVGAGWPVLMLGACLPEEYDRAVRDDVMLTLSTPEEARCLAAAAERCGRRALVHLKVDTGMSRLGVIPEAAPALARSVLRLPALRLRGIYTHFAAVEDDAEFTGRQREVFAEVVRQVQEAAGPLEYVHANNSGGLLWEPDTCCNTVRPGLIVYGVVPPGTRPVRTRLARELCPALSLRCRVTLVKDLRPGDSVSYGRSFWVRRKMRLATLSAGYGDGYLRAGSSRAAVLIGGRRCRVVGRITMDQMMVDVTSLPQVRPGDEAVLIGTQGTRRIGASDVAGWVGTVPWEVLTAITYRVPRIYRGSQAA
jgi:alanine racemase